MIEFGNPWMLLGLLAALVPVAVHLLGRSKAPVVHFSALAFVLAANPRKARALQVSEWLLVALRSLAVALVPLALAKPMLPLPGGGVGLEDAQGQVALVLVLDDSMSTMALGRGEPLFEKARLRALSLIERLPTGSKVAVVASGYPARMLVRQATTDRGAVLDAVRRLEHHPRRDDAARALALADALLAGAGLEDRRVLVMTDLQASGWRGVTAPWAGRDKESPIQLRIDRLEAQTTDNTAIVDAVATPAAERGPNQVRIEVAISHHGKKAFRDYLTLRAGDREIKSLVNLQPGETLRRSYVLPGTAPFCEILLPDDGLAPDNRRLLRLDGGAAVRVALVNGAPRPVSREDEVFFAARALEMGSARAGEMTVDVLQLPGLTPASLKDYDVIVLANVGELPAPLVTGLIQAVQAGKGLLVTVGDNLPEDLASFLPGLLPAPLFGQRGATRDTGTAKPAGGAIQALRIADPDPASAAAPPIVQRLRQQLAGVLGEGLAATAVYRYALLAPSAQVSAQTVLRYSDGAPALVTAPLGRGVVAVLTTTLDRDWTDLPLQPGYLPMLHDLAVALAGERGLERRSAIEIGDVAVLSRDERADQLEVQLEGGGAAARVVLQAAAQRGRGWQVAGLLEPGRYVATELHGGTPITSRSIIAVPPTSESDLAVLTTGPLVQQGKLGHGGGHQTPKAPGWTAMLLLLFSLLILEGVILARGHWRRRAPGHG